MKKVLERLYHHEELDRQESRNLMLEIAEEKYNELQLASLLTVFRMRPISFEEFSGFRDAILERMIAVDYDRSQLIDMCGTGGDGKDTFNISTLASVIVAGAGYKVAKHGNGAISSVCGSSNDIQGIGYKFSNDACTLISCCTETTWTGSKRNRGENFFQYDGTTCKSNKTEATSRRRLFLRNYAFL